MQRGKFVMKYNPLRKKRLVLITAAIMGVVVTTGFVVLALAEKPVDYQQLVGQWVRATGGYVLDIRSAGPDGKLEAVYLNPQPVNVSKAQASISEGKTDMLVELRDTHYPGNYYMLTYDRQTDRLVGMYHHLGVGQGFDIIFSRKDDPG